MTRVLAPTLGFAELLTNIRGEDLRRAVVTLDEKSYDILFRMACAEVEESFGFFTVRRDGLRRDPLFEIGGVVFRRGEP